VVDVDDNYLDLALVFYGGLRQEQATRLWQPVDVLRAGLARPPYVVRFDRGSLVRLEHVNVAGRTLELGGTPYDELEGFSAPVHVYRLREMAGQAAP
jgi:hypothetical protein